MSREAWGDPSDPEPTFCPQCGGQDHVEGCELGAMQVRAVRAELIAARLLKALESVLPLAEEALVRPRHDLRILYAHVTIKKATA